VTPVTAAEAVASLRAGCATAARGAYSLKHSENGNKAVRRLH
jgi:hypothetical protein